MLLIIALVDLCLNFNKSTISVYKIFVSVVLCLVHEKVIINNVRDKISWWLGFDYLYFEAHAQIVLVLVLYYAYVHNYIMYIAYLMQMKRLAGVK